MARADLDQREQVLTGELIETDEDYLEVVFANMGIDEALAAYLDAESGIGEQDVEALLASFSVRVAESAWKNGAIDTGLVRFAFEHLTDSMNEVASEKFGYKPPQTTAQAVLGWLGVGREPERYVRPLDDRYWSQQFMDQYENGGNPMAQRQGGESDQAYLARYIHGCMQGFLFAPFTYLG